MVLYLSGKWGLTVVQALEGHLLSVCLSVGFLQIWEVSRSAEALDHGVLLQVAFKHDLFTDVPQGVSDVSRWGVTSEHVTHVFPCRFVPSHICKISVKMNPFTMKNFCSLLYKPSIYPSKTTLNSLPFYL